MVFLAPKLNDKSATIERQINSEKMVKGADSQAAKQPSLLQAIIEGFVDGVLIVTEGGDWVHSNERARRICHKLCQDTSQVNSVPKPIWHICESLIDSRDIFPDQSMIIEDEIDTDDCSTFRIRARWFAFEETAQPYILVTMEDRLQSTQNTAVAEIKKFGLTSREAEVWLLRRSNYSYKEIAAKLYITHNTVKKHLKNIYAKQQEMLWEEE
ncbi:MAG: LuxR C-terminal-related transcriptional regulator [Potamolinea sp.]